MRVGPVFPGCHRAHCSRGISCWLGPSEGVPTPYPDYQATRSGRARTHPSIHHPISVPGLIPAPPFCQPLRAHRSTIGQGSTPSSVSLHAAADGMMPVLSRLSRRSGWLVAPGVLMPRLLSPILGPVPVSPPEADQRLRAGRGIRAGYSLRQPDCSARLCRPDSVATEGLSPWLGSGGQARLELVTLSRPGFLPGG